MAVRKKTSLSRNAAKFLAGKRPRDVERLLARRTIKTKRRKGRILSASNKWQDWECDLLGQFSDREVAKRTGRSRAAVEVKRLKLRLLRRAFHAATPWTREDLDLLGKVPDKEIARRLGRNYK